VVGDLSSLFVLGGLPRGFMGLIEPASQYNSPPAANRPFQFNKRSQLFIRTHNETLSVVAMRVCNPDCSPVGINR
jgi:hypothetical protein